MARMMAELFGKLNGYCRGRVAACISRTSGGYLGANGIVGAAFRSPAGAGRPSECRRRSSGHLLFRRRRHATGPSTRASTSRPPGSCRSSSCAKTTLRQVAPRWRRAGQQRYLGRAAAATVSGPVGGRQRRDGGVRGGERGGGAGPRPAGGRPWWRRERSGWRGHAKSDANPDRDAGRDRTVAAARPITRFERRLESAGLPGPDRFGGGSRRGAERDRGVDRVRRGSPTRTRRARGGVYAGRRGSERPGGRDISAIPAKRWPKRCAATSRCSLWARTSSCTAALWVTADLCTSSGRRRCCETPLSRRRSSARPSAPRCWACARWRRCSSWTFALSRGPARQPGRQAALHVRRAGQGALSCAAARAGTRLGGAAFAKP